MTAIIKRWDTGSPRGEPNYWMVSVNGVTIWMGYNGAESKRIENIVREACELVVQPQRAAVPDEIIRDVNRYKVLREHSTPAAVAESMKIKFEAMSLDEDIGDRIDSYCDAMLAAAPDREGS